MNKSGLPDPTAEMAVSRADKEKRRQDKQKHILDVVNALNKVASLHGLKIVVVTDASTGKEWRFR